MKHQGVLWVVLLTTAVVGATTAEDNYNAQRRSLSLSSLHKLLGLVTDNKHHTSKYPIWKVHKYTGIHLKPVISEDLEDTSLAELKQAYGAPPEEIHIGEMSNPGSEEQDTAAALSALDNLGSLVAFLPDQQSRSFDVLSGDDQTPQAEEKLGLVTSTIKGKKLLALLALAKALKGKKPGTSGIGGLLSAIGGLGGRETVYTLPTTYSSGGFLSNLPFFSLFSGSSHGKVPLPQLPALPKIPNLVPLPELPALPHITLPAKYKVPASFGSYIRVKLPERVPLTPPHKVHSPSIQYSLPVESPPPQQSTHTEPYPPPQYGNVAMPQQVNTYQTDSDQKVNYQTDNYHTSSGQASNHQSGPYPPPAQYSQYDYTYPYPPAEPLGPSYENLPALYQNTQGEGYSKVQYQSDNSKSSWAAIPQPRPNNGDIGAHGETIEGNTGSL